MPSLMDDPTDLLARVQAIAAALPRETSTSARATVQAATVQEAHFRAECEQRPVATSVHGHDVTVFPIGMRPAASPPTVAITSN